MSPEISWYNDEHTAFFIRYEVGWTWDQHHAMVARLRQMGDEHEINPILCLLDLRGTTVPFDSPAGEHYTEPRENSFIVIVLDNMFTRTVAQLVIRARGREHQILLAGTLEEGNALLDAQLVKMQSSTATHRKTHP
jgi:hypothetical protein